jgi:hypothetical protein
MKGLHAAIGSQLGESFLNGSASVDIAPYEVDSIGRDLDLQPLGAFVDEAMRLHVADPVASDSWLAPRVHYALRLTRREAADRSLWRHLAVASFPDYVRWRWAGRKGVALDRFVGPEYKHALGRLWWGAELARNGPDYATVAKMFEMQDIPNNLQRMNMFHNRAMALASIRYLSTLDAGSNAVGRDVNKVGKAVNLVMTTTVLDAAAPDRGPDVNAVDEWIAGSPDETKFMVAAPEGPDEDPVDPESIRRVEGVIDRVAKTLPLRAYAKSKDGAAAVESTFEAKSRDEDGPDVGESEGATTNS